IMNSWVKLKRTFIVIDTCRINIYAAIVTISAALLLEIVLLAMILQLVNEIKHGMVNSSTATKKYQARAV
ncbi:hypothetical protein PENTCL1PPCAC_5082, partial [Pristionchus entomophagus]